MNHILSSFEMRARIGHRWRDVHAAVDGDGIVNTIVPRVVADPHQGSPAATTRAGLRAPTTSSPATAAGNDRQSAALSAAPCAPDAAVDPVAVSPVAVSPVAVSPAAGSPAADHLAASGLAADDFPVNALPADVLPADDLVADDLVADGLAADHLPAGNLSVADPLLAGVQRLSSDEAEATIPVDANSSLPAATDLSALDAIVDALAAGYRPGRDWEIFGRDHQRPPPGDWRSWLLLGGRGSGKTRAGAEWVHGLASAGARSQLRIALVAETLGDAREVMIDGVSGICRVSRLMRPDFEISRRRLVWPNGAVAQIFSSEDPESLRGPQFHFAWCDELAKWKYGQDTFDMLQFGLRLGAHPRQLVTTTPRPVPWLKSLLADPATVVRRLSTQSNADNLAPGFIAALAARYGGTRLGRQELDGELIEDRDDGLWKRDTIAALTQKLTGPLRRIVVAVDPPASAGPNACCGIVVAGLEASGRAVVLADCSVEGASPAAWAGAVVKAYRRFDADRIVAEINQGGDMVTAMLRSVDANLPVMTVRATRGKFLRAEPVAALYEQGRVGHAGRFTALEDQMCDFGPDGLSSGRSPDRLDALVWALTALMLDGVGEPRVRGV